MPAEEWGLLWAAFTITRKVASRAIVVPGLTMPQASVLGVLGAAGRPLPVIEIARTLMQETQSTSTLVDRMCAKGFVERMKGPRNRHTVLVRMTEEGARILEILRASEPAFTDEMFSVLSREERATLAKLLLRLVEHNIRRLR